MIGDTIAAVSTPYGKGGVALLRVSGPDAVTLCEKVFLPVGGRTLAALEARRAVYGQILSPDGEGVWRSVDDGIATVFRAPASFTGEDTVEICCHGGILLTETVLSALFYAGARPAEAGEFTRRAFLNGKLGLSSAEALGSLLEARTREQLSLAHAGMRGKVEEASQEIYASIRRILASIYAGIDYPDEDPLSAAKRELREETGAVAGKMTFLGALDTSPALISERIYMYLAEDLSFTERELDDDEFLSVEYAHLSDLYRMVLDGEIADAKTQVAVLKAVAKRPEFLN